MKQEFEFLEKIEKAKGSKAKIELLYEMLIGDCCAEMFFRIVFNNENYGVSSRSFEIMLDYDASKDPVYFDVGELMGRNIKFSDIRYNISDIQNDIIEIHKLKGKEKVAYLRQLLRYDSLYAKWVSRAIIHDLKFGLSLKSINKVFEKIGKKPIEKFEVQLCGKFRYISDYNLGFPVQMGIKYDGERCWAVKEDGITSLTSRAGENIDYVPEIIEYLHKRFPEDFIFDMEILCKDFNALQKRIGRKAENIEPIKGLHIRIFDVLKCKGLEFDLLPQSDRTCFLRTLKEDDVLKIEETKIAYNMEDLRNFYDMAIERGEEGIVIKLIDRVYEFDSRKNWYKIKPFDAKTFKVTGAKYGTGKNAGIISTLFVEDKSGTVKSGVSQLKENDMLIAMNLEREGKLIGTFVDVEYNEITSNKKGGKSLRFARFMKFRFDKREADDLKEE